MRREFNKTFKELSTKSKEELLQFVKEQQTYLKELEIKNEELKMNEEQFRLLFENSTVGIGIADLKGNLLFYNDAILKPGNYNRKDFKINNVNELYFNPKQRDEVLALLNKQGFVNDFDVLFKRKDGTHYNASLSLSKTIFKGQPCVQAVVEDNTEKKQIEDKLKESESRFRIMFDNATYGVTVMQLIRDGAGKAIDYLHLQVNAAIYKHVGIKKEETEGKLGSEIISKDETAYLVEKFNSVVETGIPFEYEYYLPTFDRTIDIRVVHIEDDYFYVVYFDISDRIKFEKKLKENEKYLIEAQKIAHLGTYKLDLKNGKWESSEILDNIFGIDNNYSKTIEGWREIIHPDWQKEMLDYLNNYVVGLKKKFDKEYKIIRIIDNAEKWVHGFGELTFDTKGQPTIMIGTIQDITERKNAEDELIKKQKELQQFFDEDISADYLSNTDGYLLECNKTFLDLFGFKSKEEAIAYPLEKLYKNPLTRKIFIDEIKANKNIELFENEYILPSGITINTIENISGIFDNNDELVKIKGYIVDITEREKAIEKARKLSRAVEQSPVSIIITNPNGDIEYVNGKFCELTGYSKNEIIGKNPRILNSGYQDKKFYEDLWDTILSGREWTGEILNKKKNGELYWESALISALFNKYGDITSFIAVKEDITKRKQIQKELIEQKNKFLQLFENSPVSIVLLDEEDNIVQINESFSELFGYFLEEIEGKSLNKIIVPDEYKNEALEYSDNTHKGNQIDVEGFRKKKDGTLVFVQIIGTPIIIDEKTVGIYGMYVDQTQRREFEREIIMAKEKAEESSKLKSHFLALMSHELRTPLVGILGYSEILIDEIKDPELHGYSDSIYKAGTRLKNTLNAILNLSRLSVEQKQIDFVKTDITEQIGKIVKSFEDEAKLKNLKLKYSNQNEKLFCNIDKTVFELVINNFISNALKYTKQGSIEIRISEETEIENRWIKIEVEDTGIGIPKDKIGIIFDEFRQVDEGMARHFEGVGLGLTISKKYVEMLNGKISVDSQLGKGSIFTIKIPLVSSDNNKSEIKKKSQENTENNNIYSINDKSINLKTKDEKVILVVEDEELNAKTIKKFLDKTYTVEIAHTPMEALEKCKLKQYNLVLMDINLKSSIDGIELKKQIESKYQNYNKVQFIAQTAYALASDKAKIMESGFTDYIVKPFSKVELNKIVNKNISISNNN